MLEGEMFKDIKGFEGLYQISSHGRILSMERQVKTKHGFRKVRERILKKSPDKDGYLMVTLSKDSKTKKCKVHRLVGEYFLDNPDNLPQVNHIDEDKTNNYYRNLEYVINLKNTNNYHSKNGTRKYGVHMSQGKWRARIKKDGKTIHIGQYEDKDIAYQAFHDKYKELHGVKPW
jgi:hypothetical protein